MSFLKKKNIKNYYKFYFMLCLIKKKQGGKTPQFLFNPITILGLGWGFPLLFFPYLKIGLHFLERLNVFNFFMDMVVWREGGKAHYNFFSPDHKLRHN